MKNPTALRCVVFFAISCPDLEVATLMNISTTPLRIALLAAGLPLTVSSVYAASNDVHKKETHVSVAWAALNEMLDFAVPLRP
jgi:hypothetical protein